MFTDEQIARQYRTLRLLTIMLLIFSPIMYIVAIRLVNRQGTLAIRPNELFFYALLALSAIQGALIPLVERLVLASLARQKRTGGALLEGAQSVVICKLAFVEAIYIYGVATFFVTGSDARLPYFYAFGIFYSILFWPTEARFRRIVEQLEAQ